MSQRTLNRISTLSRPRSEPEGGGVSLAYLWVLPAGLLVPLLVVIIGLIWVLLNEGGLLGPHVALGASLRVPLSPPFSAQSALVQLTELVVAGVATALLYGLAAYATRRAADHRARRIAYGLHQRVLQQSLKRAELEGAAAQHVHAQNLIGNALPLIHKGLSLWYSVIPLEVVTLIGCLVLSLLVNVWLTLLAVVSGLLLWQLYRQLRDVDESAYTDWEVGRARRRMAEIVGQAPLLGRLQSDGLADDAFASELTTLFRCLERDNQRRSRVWPLLFSAIAVAVAIMILGLGVNLLHADADRGLSVPAALVLTMALVAVAATSLNLLSLATLLRDCGAASDLVYAYLAPGDHAPPSEQRVGLAGLRERVQIEDVTLGPAGSKAILRHFSLTLTPGSLVAVLGTESVSTRALVELLMGFGQPAEGRVTIDGIPLRNVHPQALAEHVMWIEPDGPIWHGTIQDNLTGGGHSLSSIDLVQALQEVDAYERLNRLPEGLNTIVSPGDHMLGIDLTYALATARALLHRPPILIAAEPPPAAEQVADDPCLKALRRLADEGTLVVILPRRLSTLRAADRVVLLNGPRLAGEGKHADLLAHSDLYRHLNYLLFNPYRDHTRKADEKRGV